MAKRKGEADVLMDVDESKKAKSDTPLETFTDEPREAETLGSKDLDYLQIIITGPRKCGKSWLVVTYMGQLLPPSNIDFLSKQYLKILPDKKQPVMIWDLDARDNYSEYRRQSYQEADIALLCFDIRVPKDFNDQSAHRLENLLQPWIAELDEYCNDIPIILVGLKGDLKINPESNIFSEEDIRNLMRRRPRIKPYKEVSAYANKAQVTQLFESAISNIKKPKPKVMFANYNYEIRAPNWLI